MTRFSLTFIVTSFFFWTEDMTFHLRDLFWLMLVSALIVSWAIDRSRLLVTNSTLKEMVESYGWRLTIDESTGKVVMATASMRQE